MSHNAPLNEDRVKDLNPKQKQGYQKMLAIMADIEQKDPGLKTQVFTPVRNKYIADSLAFNRLEEETRELSNAERQEAFARFAKEKADSSREAFAPWQNDPAFKELNRRLAATNKTGAAGGIVQSITSSFYDENDNGWQWGGIIGAGLGAAAMYFFGGGLGGGGWVSTLLMIGAALAGGFLGNKAGDFISGLGKDKNAESGQTQSQGQGQSQSQELSPEARAIRENAAAVAEQYERDRKIAALPAETKAAAAATGLSLRLVTGFKPNIDPLQYDAALKSQQTPAAPPSTEHKR